MFWQFLTKAIRVCLALVLLALGPALLTRAQTDPVNVPDLTGLNVPQAAAALNLAGLRLGAQRPLGWTAAMPQEPGTIASQSAAAGDSVPYGTAIDVNVLSAASIRLVYDDNDLTMINNTGARLELAQFVFSGTGGTKRFAAAGWRPRLDAGDCTQIWSVARGEAKNVAGCGSVFWLTSNNTTEHFWTQAAGAERFDVVQDGTAVATCDAAAVNSQDVPVTCEFFVLAGRGGRLNTPYLYFAYTPDSFAVVNTSDDSWMRLDTTPIEIPGLRLSVGDPALYGNPDIVADIRRLAPGQCLLLTLSAETGTSTPEPCSVIAQHVVSQAQAFWTVPFELLPASRPDEHLTCPAATEGHVTLCVMPR